MSTDKQTVQGMFRNGMSRNEISKKTGIPRTTVRRWVAELVDDDVTDSPLSETAIPKIHDCTRDEALDDLRAIAEANPEKIISRNYYRVNGKYAESAWNQYFGTFLEFKRQAGLVLTRQQHAIERDIARHASIDHYRAMDDELKGYADKFTVPNANRFKKAVIISDLHDKEVDPFFMEVLIDTLYRVDPDLVVINGDLFDLPEFGKYTVDPRDWDVVGRIKYAHENILAPIRKACPSAQIDFIGGNHDQRLLKHLADASPAMRAVLSDLHGMTIGTLLGLDQFKINFISKGSLATYSIVEQHKEAEKNYKIYYNSFIVGHEPMYSQLGFPGVSGHHHKTEVSTHYNAHFGAYQWVQTGGGHKLDSEYSMSKWNLGFCIALCDTQTRETVFDVVTFTQNMAVVGGKVYTRK